MIRYYSTLTKKWYDTDDEALAAEQDYLEHIRVISKQIKDAERNRDFTMVLDYIKTIEKKFDFDYQERCGELKEVYDNLCFARNANKKFASAYETFKQAKNDLEVFKTNAKRSMEAAKEAMVRKFVDKWGELTYEEKELLTIAYKDGVTKK